MKLVSWMACWRRCSLALLSGESEDLGKQVNTHKQTCKYSVSCFSGVIDFFHTSIVCILYLNHYLVPLHFSLHLYVSVNTQQQNCLCSPVSVPSVARLRDWIVVAFSGQCCSEGRANSTSGWHNNKRKGRVPRVGLGSNILRKEATDEGVATESKI